MIVLALESATTTIGVALFGDDGPIASLSVRATRRHLESLHPAIEAVLAQSGVGLEQLDAIIVDIGPGRFTGMRVGLASAKSFAFALEIPLVGLTSTEILAAGALGGAELVVPVIDMRRGEIAWQLHPGDTEISLGVVEDLAGILKGIEKTSVRLVGDGALRYGLQLQGLVRPRTLALCSAREVSPDPLVLAELGHLALSRGETSSAEELQALYLREADARANFVTRDEPNVPASLASGARSGVLG